MNLIQADRAGAAGRLTVAAVVMSIAVFWRRYGGIAAECAYAVE